MRKILLALLAAASLLHADQFSQGKTSLGVYFGAGSSLGYNYTVAGISGYYFVSTNLAVGGMYRNWFGNGPTQNEVSVFSNYYIPLDKKFRPYVGIFARQTYIDSDIIQDYGSYGARGGVSIITSSNSYVSLGYAVEYYDRCGVAGECHNTYPEVLLGFSF